MQEAWGQEEEGEEGGDVLLREDSLARSLLAQPDNPCKDNNQRDYQEMSRKGKLGGRVELVEEEEKNHLKSSLFNVVQIKDFKQKSVIFRHGSKQDFSFSWILNWS